MSCPEWEDADFSGNVGDPFYPDWWACDLGAFKRPRWFAQGPLLPCIDYLIARSSEDRRRSCELWDKITQKRKFLCSQSILSRMHRLMLKVRRVILSRLHQLILKILHFFYPNNNRIRRYILGVFPYVKNPTKLINRFRNIAGKIDNGEPDLNRIEKIKDSFRHLFPARKDLISQEDLIPWAINGAQWKKLFGLYDVVQMYATFPIIPLLCGFERFAAYEHGTIREIPFEENAQGRICAIGYKLSPAVFVTNSDNLLAAERLGLDDKQVYCLPHAFDTEKLFHFGHENKDRYAPPVDKVVFFSPARQHWKDKDPSMAKGNDYVFHAVHALKNEGYTFTLELVEWGRDVKDSKQLIGELGIDDYIVWVPTMKKRNIWLKYMSVHAVIDQLLLPALGGVGFESMALGRRLLTAMDMELGERFFGAPPPVFDIRDTQSVKEAMRGIIEDPQDCGGIGNDAREWIRGYHSSDKICQIQVNAYSKILKKQGKNSAKVVTGKLNRCCKK